MSRNSQELKKIQIEPVEKIAIYHEHSINKIFLIPAYIAICKRDKPLTFSEGIQLGMETVLRVADTREWAHQRAAESGVRSPTFDDFEDGEMESMVKEVFGITSQLPSSIAQTSNSSSHTNGSTYTDSTKVNGSATAKASGGSSIRTNGSSNPVRSSMDTTHLYSTAKESLSTSSPSSTHMLVPSSLNAGSKLAASVLENKTPPEKPKASEQMNASSTTSPSTDPFQAGCYKPR